MTDAQFNGLVYEMRKAVEVPPEPKQTKMF